MTSKILSNTPLNDLTKDQWQAICKKGAKRGNHIDRLAKAIQSKGVDQLSYDSTQGTIAFVTDTGKKKYSVDLNKIKACKSTWSLSRFSDWVTTTFFFKDKTNFNSRMDHLASLIKEKLSEENPLPQQNGSPPQNTAANEPPAPDFYSKEGVIPRADLFLIKTALVNANVNGSHPALVSVGEESAAELYNLWFNPEYSTIQIQGVAKWGSGSENKLGLQIDPGTGELLYVFVDGEKQPDDFQLSAAQKQILETCFKKALDHSSSYGLSANSKFIEIKIVDRGISKASFEHLNKLVSKIKESMLIENHPRMNTMLLKNDLTPAAGSDNGGISRVYLNTLVESMIHDGKCHFKMMHPSKLAFPSARQQSVDSLPHLNTEEMTIYKDLGAMMMFCYRSELNTEDFKNNEYGIGEHFDKQLFDLAFSFKASDLKKEFSAIELSKKVALMKAIAKSRMDSDSDHFSPARSKTMLRFFDLLKWKEGDPLPDDALMGEIGPMEALAAFADDFGSVDMELVHADPSKFMQCAQKAVLNFSFDEDVHSIASLIAPIHAIAQGLMSISDLGHENWDAGFFTLDGQVFSDKIQGRLDRAKIINSFVVNYKKGGSDAIDLTSSERIEMDKKILWLKNWITNETTSDEALRKFLVYATGANSLSANQKLYFRAQVDSNLVPNANTCQSRIYLSASPCSLGVDNDFTEEGFCNILKKYIIEDTVSAITLD